MNCIASLVLLSEKVELKPYRSQQLTFLQDALQTYMLVPIKNWLQIKMKLLTMNGNPE